MKFVISFTVLVAFVVTIAAKHPLVRYLPDLPYCKSKVGIFDVNMNKLVSNFMNGVGEVRLHYCLAACLVKKAKILDDENRLNMTRIEELTKPIDNRRDECYVTEFVIKCAIPEEH